MRRKLSLRLKAGKPGLKKVLGDLEEQIMEVIWGKEKVKYPQVTVRDVYEFLRKKRKIAYTTIMTTMKILTDKGILRRKKIGKAYLYQPLYTKEEFSETVVNQVVASLMDGFAKPLLSHFVDIVRSEDMKVAATLEKILNQKIASRGGEFERE